MKANEPISIPDAVSNIRQQISTAIDTVSERWAKEGRGGKPGEPVTAKNFCEFLEEMSYECDKVQCAGIFKFDE